MNWKKISEIYAIQILSQKVFLSRFRLTKRLTGSWISSLQQIKKFEFCAICKNPIDFNAEKKKSLGSFAYEIEQLDEFKNDLKNLEKTIIENTKVIKLVNDIYEKRDL